MEATNQLHDRLHDLDLALQVGDHDNALRHARDLRAGADGLCMRLTPLVFSSEKQIGQHGPIVSEVVPTLGITCEVANG